MIKLTKIIRKTINNNKKNKKNKRNSLWFMCYNYIMIDGMLVVVKKIDINKGYNSIKMDIQSQLLGLKYTNLKEYIKFIKMHLDLIKIKL